MNTKEINELILTYNIFADDTVVVEQSGVAKRIKAHLFLQQDKDRFKGWFISAAQLSQLFPVCSPGDYAYVGTLLNQSVVYRCATSNTWTNTNEAVSLPVIDLTPLTTRMDKVERDMVQLEQEQNLMRSDVQGVSFGQPLRTSTKIDLTKAFTFSTYITVQDDLAPSTPIAYVSQDTNLYDTEFNGLAIYKYYDNTLRVKFGIVGNTIYYGIPKSVYYNRPIKIDVAFDGISTARIYLNGQNVQTYTNVSTTGIADKPLLLNKCIIHDIRIFNSELSQQLIDSNYNQGRAGEVQLGNEWRVPVFDRYINNTSFTAVDQNQYGWNWRVAFSARYIGNCRVKINITSSEKIAARIYIATSDPYTEKRQLITMEAGTFDYYFDFNNINNLAAHIGMWDIPISCIVTINSIDIYPMTLLHEYLPQYLTSTKWIDSGLSKQNIAYTNPIFTNIESYPQIQFGSGAPSVPPLAAGQQYFDTATGRLWISRPLPSPISRQFEVSDWGNPILK